MYTLRRRKKKYNQSSRRTKKNSHPFPLLFRFCHHLGHHGPQLAQTENLKVARKWRTITFNVEILLMTFYIPMNILSIDFSSFQTGNFSILSPTSCLKMKICLRLSKTERLRCHQWPQATFNEKRHVSLCPLRRSRNVSNVDLITFCIFHPWHYRR